MLALYDKMMKAPDDLTTAPPIYIEKTQTPLALIQMSDEEMVSLFVLVCSPGTHWLTCCLISFPQCFSLAYVAARSQQ